MTAVRQKMGMRVKPLTRPELGHRNRGPTGHGNSEESRPGAGEDDHIFRAPSPAPIIWCVAEFPWWPTRDINRFELVVSEKSEKAPIWRPEWRRSSVRSCKLSWRERIQRTDPECQPVAGRAPG